jgi:hypothetical protein
MLTCFHWVELALPHCWACTCYGDRLRNLLATLDMVHLPVFRYFATAEEAAAAYDAAAFTALGNAAHLNFRPSSNLMSASGAPAAAFTMGAPQPVGATLRCAQSHGAAAHALSACHLL